MTFGSTTLTLMVILVPIYSGNAQISPVKPAEPSISITISTPNRLVSAGAMIPLKIVVKNISNHDVLLSKSNGKMQGEFVYGVEARDSHGNLVPRTRYAQELDRSPAIMGDMLPVLHPGETLDDGMIVNKMVDLSIPDDYSIQVLHNDPTSKTVVKSSVLTINVQ